MSHNPFAYAGYDPTMWQQPVVTAVVQVENVPLFYSANWRIVIKVNGDVLWESHEEPYQPTKEEIQAWVGMIIKNNYSIMKLNNINMAKLYKSVGGDPSDLLIY